MTDSEIIKALECCKYDDCNNCPNVSDNCHANLVDYVLDLINRQKEEIKRLQKEVNLVSIQFQDIQERQEESQAEIERLKEKNNHFANIGKMDSKIKAEAIKEFAEKVLNEIREAIISNDKAIKEREEKHNVNRYEDNFCSMCDGKISALGGIRYFINNLVKEMVGE